MTEITNAPSLWKFVFLLQTIMLDVSITTLHFCEKNDMVYMDTGLVCEKGQCTDLVIDMRYQILDIRQIADRLHAAMDQICHCEAAGRGNLQHQGMMTAAPINIEYFGFTMLIG